ncbi:hypothetical protein ACEQPO_23760 [Bacillus sp. SL00103]
MIRLRLILLKTATSLQAETIVNVILVDFRALIQCLKLPCWRLRHLVFYGLLKTQGKRKEECADEKN